ncbi:MAG TPA: NADH-quinone oxidoreductase subunit C [Chromatiales bacterium]|nr:NADH-quinone oxidoreductase subunit C [Thiotrichales bacterium]HIP67108.1 NADH-quinone oxidoreductase subunit C [Chromatiales bacterium]
MSELEQLSERLQATFSEAIEKIELALGELAIVVKPEHMLTTCLSLRDDFGFEELIDIAGVDYLHYGATEWATDEASSEGFSRGVQPEASGRFTFHDAPGEYKHEGPRFAVAYQLLSIANNQRLRVKIFCPDDNLPVVDSVVDVWNGANWFEREAFDLFGIIFKGHPDLRRLLTDYGFVGHPFRKDFPLIGNVEMRYDPEQKRVIYQPVSIEPRVLVPRVIREQAEEKNDA